jgi:hypothetical protein
MSDDILTVSTPFADVVALAQGYLNRADGERLLLPLESAQPEGTGVRFVVLLGDGTPAFAGAGLCSQVSDQGTTVPSDQRFETLLDSLQFDDRSRPVYEYIVAVRNAAYSQQSSSDETEVAQPEAMDADLEALDAGATVEHEEEEATAIVSPGAMAAARAAMPSSTPEDGEQVLWSPGTADAAEAEPASSWAPSGPPPSAPSYQAPSMPSYSPASDPPTPSFVPPPIPMGILTRPARAAHWQPRPPRRPSARPSTGRFHYPAGALPRPARPPRPDLDPSQRITPAPRAGR